MYEGFFSPLHLLLLLISAASVFGAPFLAGFFLGRYVELKKSKKETGPPVP
jgi:hypothetical protein